MTPKVMCRFLCSFPKIAKKCPKGGKPGLVLGYVGTGDGYGQKTLWVRRGDETGKTGKNGKNGGKRGKTGKTGKTGKNGENGENGENWENRENPGKLVGAPLVTLVSQRFAGDRGRVSEDTSGFHTFPQVAF